MELPARNVLSTLDDTVPNLLLKTDITGGIGPEGAVGGAVSGLTEVHEHGTPTVKRHRVEGGEEVHNHANQQRNELNKALSASPTDINNCGSVLTESKDANSQSKVCIFGILYIHKL